MVQGKPRYPHFSITRMKLLHNPMVTKLIKEAKLYLHENGELCENKQWQSSDVEMGMYEVLDLSLATPIPFMNYDDTEDFEKLAELCKAQMPWALNHLKERLSGFPYNPGETFKQWRYYKHKPSDDKFREDEQFSHTYMERFWPKEANKSINKGIRYSLGDVKDIINLLQWDSTSRQAYLPVYFPEDTGLSHREKGARVPCTIGYHFLIRKGQIHCTYHIRSCDALRHFNDDIFLAMGLTLFVMKSVDRSLKPGWLKMHIGSFHCFYGEKEILKVAK